MKKLFIMLTILVTSTGIFAQSTKSVPKKMSYTVGAVAQFPIKNSVDTKTPMFGEMVTIACRSTQKLAYTVSGSYFQNKKSFVQVPVLAGVRYNLMHNVYVGGEAGVSFYNQGVTKFTYSPSVSLAFKRIVLSERFLSSVKNGKASSSVGVGVSYRL